MTRALLGLCLFALGCGSAATQGSDWPPAGSGGKGDASSKVPVCGQKLVDRIHAATQDEQLGELLFLSESDRPLTPVQWSAASVGEGGVDAETLRRLVHVPEGVSIEERAFRDWFDRIAVVQDWMDDQQKVDAERFAVIRDLMDTTLTHERVFRYATPNDDSIIEIYVLGLDACGNVVGFFTEAVET